MINQKIRVIEYSGYKGEESPRAFIINNKRIDVFKILSAWIEEEVSASDRKRYFTVNGSDNKKYVLYYDCDSMQWYICQ